MVKGRNTTVISLRLPDDDVKRLKVKARNVGLTLSDYLKQNIKPLHSPNVGQVVSDGLEDTNRPPKFVGAQKTPSNAPCPCGSKHPDGKPKKYKHCCLKQSSK